MEKYFSAMNFKSSLSFLLFNSYLLIIIMNYIALICSLPLIVPIGTFICGSTQDHSYTLFIIIFPIIYPFNKIFYLDLNVSFIAFKDLN